MSYSDRQLKRCLAKMLPSVFFDGKWLRHGNHTPVLDTELLHLCRLVEQTLDSQISDIRSLYLDYLGCVVGWGDAKNPADAQFEAAYNSVSATWQQRVIALAKVKGIEL